MAKYMYNKAVKKVSDFIYRNYKKELDKYNDGYEHNLFEWLEVKNEWNNIIFGYEEENDVNLKIMCRLDKALKILKENNLMYKFEK